MKILMINVVCGIRSTGRICTDLALELESQGHEVKIAYGREFVPEKYARFAYRIGTDLDIKLHGLKARLLDGCGYGSKSATKKFIKWIVEYNPDIIHLHNLHGYYINIEVLFDYLRTCGKRIIWTLHDCWAFTGHAAYCEGANCERWIKGCYHCPKTKEYPASLFDRSNRNWAKKQRIFKDIPNLTLVTPSVWLKNLVSKSFLGSYETIVINNGIDTKHFKKCDISLDLVVKFKERKIILGVASAWDKRKGLNDFLELNNLIDKEHYVIILVGINKEQIKSLPEGIVGIERTDSVQELAELYSLAYVFVNPTYEDNYPTTNLEAIACGTPVITYMTGGSPESANYYGISLPKGDVVGIAQIIKNYKFINSKSMNLDKNITAEKYVTIYEEQN